MHSGIRGGPHVGALRRCSFANTESDSKSIHEHLPKAHLPVSIYRQVLKVALLPSVLQLLRPEFFQDAPLTKLIPSQIDTDLKKETEEGDKRF